MRLINVHPPLTGWFPFRVREYDPAVVSMLYALLAEREPYQSISHRAMPTFAAHCEFVMSVPYTAWYAVEANAELVGAVYLSRQDEIGIGILRHFQHRGYAAEAVKMLMQAHPRERYLANVAPRNHVSSALFVSLGFDLIQYTYAKEKAA